MKPSSVTISPGSVSIPMVTGRVARPSLSSTQKASQSVVVPPTVTYQTSAAPVIRVVNSQASSAAVSAVATPAVPVAASAPASIVRSVQAQSCVRLAPQAAPQVVRTIRSPVGSVVTGSAITGSTVTGSVVRGSAVTGSAVTGSAVTGSAVTSSAASRSVGTRPVVVQGPTYTQGTYEAKHEHDDPHLKTLKDLRRTCGLKNVPVGDGLSTLKSGAENGKLTRQQFMQCYEAVLQAHEVEVPPETVRTAVWELFDRDGNEVVDMMELVCGISLLCAGTEEEKIHAVFNVFDENSDGFISMDEMFKFLTSVFKVVLTPNVLGVMSAMGVSVQSAEDLASVTALECFKTADLNHDGRLSVVEFKNWFYTPRNDPTALFSPTQKLLP